MVRGKSFPFVQKTPKERKRECEVDWVWERTRVTDSGRECSLFKRKGEKVFPLKIYDCSGMAGAGREMPNVSKTAALNRK